VAFVKFAFGLDLPVRPLSPHGEASDRSAPEKYFARPAAGVCAKFSAVK
jgi:hypothetical protein